MGEHFGLLVDGLVPESTLEGGIESRNSSTKAKYSENEHNIDVCVTIMVECRICHEEDEDCNMETPCSCCGTLKYAHRKCIQRWCNEKGDTTCEICRQQFKPGYTTPSHLFRYGRILPINLRTNWDITRTDIYSSRFIAMVTTDQDFLDSDIEDYTTAPRNLICCRIVAIIFTVFLALRHTLPIMICGLGDYSSMELTLLLLKTLGIFLPLYIMIKIFIAIQQHRHPQQDSETYVAVTIDEESEVTTFTATAPPTTLCSQ